MIVGVGGWRNRDEALFTPFVWIGERRSMQWRGMLLFLHERTAAPRRPLGTREVTTIT